MITQDMAQQFLAAVKLGAVQINQQLQVVWLRPKEDPQAVPRAVLTVVRSVPGGQPNQVSIEPLAWLLDPGEMQYVSTAYEPCAAPEGSPLLMPDKRIILNGNGAR